MDESREELNLNKLIREALGINNNENYKDLTLKQEEARGIHQRFTFLKRASCEC